MKPKKTKNKTQNKTKKTNQKQPLLEITIPFAQKLASQTYFFKVGKSTWSLCFDEEGWATARKSSSRQTRAARATLTTDQDEGTKQSK